MTRSTVKYLVGGALLLTLLLINRTVAGQSVRSPASTHVSIVTQVSAPLATVHEGFDGIAAFKSKSACRAVNCCTVFSASHAAGSTHRPAAFVF